MSKNLNYRTNNAQTQTFNRDMEIIGRRVVSIGVLVLGFFLMSGCTKGQFAEFMNGTDAVLRVTTIKGEIKIQQGGRGLLPIMDIGEQFIVEADGRKLRYIFKFPGNDYALQTQTKTVFRFLIDSNYVIYAMLPNVDPSQGKPSAQPVGLPMQPIK